MQPNVLMPASAKARRRYAYAISVSLLSVLALYLNALPVFRESLRAYLGIDDARMGMLFGAGPLAGALAVLLAGPLLNRIGPVRMIRFSLWGQAAGMMVVAASGSFWLGVLAGATICGLFLAPFTIAANAYLTRLFPRDRRKILSLGLAMIGAGGILTPLAAEFLLHLSASVPGISFGSVLRWPFLAIGTVLFFAGFGYGSGRGATNRSGRPDSPALWRQFLLPLPLFWLVLLLALHGATDTTIYMWMPRFLGSKSFTTHPLVPGVVLAGMSLAYLVSRSLLALLPDNFGRRAFLALPGILGGGVVLAGILTRSFRCAAGGYVLGAFVWSTEYPAMLGAVADRGKPHFGPAMALIQIIGGPLTAGLVLCAGKSISWLDESRIWQVMAVLACGFLLVGAGGGIWSLLQRGAPARTDR